MIAVRGDTIEMVHQRVAELLHLGQSLQAKGFQPAEEKPGDALARLVDPEAIELFAEHVCVEESSVRGEELPQFLPLRFAHCHPAP